jgi:hypothetical protein
MRVIVKRAAFLTRRDRDSDQYASLDETFGCLDASR